MTVLHNAKKLKLFVTKIQNEVELNEKYYLCINYEHQKKQV
ncbi:hypothetical protein HMPREF9296_0518 [Prevotella disiens FB035-09AN]|uniref:Uncharacterized protein n=1 Tax=Prevotella disiens FB035-09AN TaxID=866771 RepID=E1KPM4_9BACT|nr:hypothetical protein HMPREF9296_0518 [Prevotella disiens FB035-09AN]